MGKIDASVGIVETRHSDENIDSMEAHGKPEFLVPIDGPIIQPVAMLYESENFSTVGILPRVIYNSELYIQA